MMVVGAPCPRLKSDSVIVLFIFLFFFHFFCGLEKNMGEAKYTVQVF
jgi:hypothetical protein